MNSNIGLFPIEVWMHNLECQDIDYLDLKMYDIKGAHNKSEWKLIHTYNFTCLNHSYKEGIYMTLSIEDQEKVIENFTLNDQFYSVEGVIDYKINDKAV